MNVNISNVPAGMFGGSLHRDKLESSLNIFFNVRITKKKHLKKKKKLDVLNVRRTFRNNVILMFAK